MEYIFLAKSLLAKRTKNQIIQAVKMPAFLCTLLFLRVLMRVYVIDWDWLDLLNVDTKR